MGVFLWGQKPKNTNYRISIATKQKTPLFSQRRFHKLHLHVAGELFAKRLWQGDNLLHLF
jgi:hypothetical protein